MARRPGRIHASLEFQPTRAEPFYGIARHYSAAKRYRLGHLFAERAAQIPLPADDMVVHDPAIYAWRAADEQAVCASGLGKHPEAFNLCRRLLGRADIPDDHRNRIAVNRDVSVPAMLQATSLYSEALVRNVIDGPRDADVTVSVIAGPNWSATAATLNSFLNCCIDATKVGRFLVFDHGQTPETAQSCVSATCSSSLSSARTGPSFASTSADATGWT